MAVFIVPTRTEVLASTMNILSDVKNNVKYEAITIYVILHILQVTLNNDMKGYVQNIEKLTEENTLFRKVLYTAPHSQLVVMSLKPGEDIGEEVHELDQFLRIEEGTGKAVLNDIEYPVGDGTAVVVPAGVKHNIINTSENTPLKLYTVYSPPEHRDGVEHATKEDALADEEHFDGKVTEE